MLEFGVAGSLRSPALLHCRASPCQHGWRVVHSAFRQRHRKDARGNTRHAPVHAQAVTTGAANDRSTRSSQYGTEVIETDMVVIGSGIGGGQHRRHAPDL